MVIRYAASSGDLVDASFVYGNNMFSVVLVVMVGSVVLAIYHLISNQVMTGETTSTAKTLCTMHHAPGTMHNMHNGAHKHANKRYFY